MSGATAERPGIDVDAGALLALRHAAAAARGGARGRTSALPGPFVARRRGRGSEIDEVRPWAQGDDMRHIDRNSTARTGKPHVRTFRDERDQTVLLVADFRPAMLYGTRRALRSVAAAEALALAGWRTADQGGRIGLLAAGAGEPVFVRPAMGERAMIGVAGGLSNAHRAALAAPVDGHAPDLAALIDSAERALRRTGTLVLATGLDDPGAGFEAAVGRVRLRHDLLVAVISDAFERTAPKGRYPFVTLAGTAGVHVVGARAGETEADRRVARLTALGIRAVRLDAEADPERRAAAMEALHGR